MRFRLPCAFVLGLVLTSLSSPARAEEPGALVPPAAARPPADAPPPGARTTHIVTGAATTAITYGLTFGASYLFKDNPGAKELRIPLAGPWMSLAKTGCADSNPDCSPVSLVLGAALTVFSGVIQAGGLAVIGEGLFLQTSSARPAPPKAARLTLRAVPMDFGAGSAGVGVLGTF